MLKGGEIGGKGLRFDTAVFLLVQCFIYYLRILSFDRAVSRRKFSQITGRLIRHVYIVVQKT